MKIIGIVGWKNSGKTFLAQKIISILKEKDLKVASIKRAHHDFDIDHENTDSFLHRKAGSTQVIISSSKRWVKITEIVDKREKGLKELIDEIHEADIVIVEGFKKEYHSKIEIISNSKEDYLFKKDKNIIAVVTDQDIDVNLPIFKKNNIDSLVSFILEFCNE